MRHIKLGRTDTTVPEIILGSMTWGTQTDVVDAHRQIDMAMERGVDWVDTAEMYPVNPVRAETIGRTEEIIGDWVAKGGSGLRIGTKVSGQGLTAVREGAAISPETIAAALDASLRRLKVDHIDLYQFHWPNRGSYHFRQNWTYVPKGDQARILDDMRACLVALQAAVDAGKIGAFGLSNESAWGMAQWLRLAEEGAGPRAASIQNEYSLLARMFDTDLGELSYHEDVTLWAFSPLATGLLTGKYSGGRIPDGSRRSINEELGGRWQPRVPETVDAYLAVAAKHDLDPVHMALAWLQTRPFPTTALLGATTSQQLAHGLDAIGVELSDDVIADLDETHRLHPMPF